MFEFVQLLGAICRRAKFAVGGMLLGSLVACGGGGGGGGGALASPSGADATGFSVTLDKTSIAFTYTEGSFLSSPVVVTATPHGPLPDALYVLATTEGQGISPYIPATFTQTDAQFHVSPASLPAGDYAGRVLFFACSDSQCAHPIGSTPIPVSYTVHVKKVLKVPSRVDVGAISGQSASGSVTLQLPEGASGFTARVTNGASWLSLGVADGNVLPFSAGSLHSGAYAGNIEINVDGQVTNVFVNYTVQAPAGGDLDLRASAPSLTFSAVENTQAPTQSVAILLPTWGGDRKDLQYSVTSGGKPADWLNVSATESGLSVTASAAQLAAGVYTARLQVTHPLALAPLVIPASMTVGPGMVQPADLALSVLPGTTAAALQGRIAINLASGAPVGWTASTDAPWLKLTRAAGQTGTSVEYAVDTTLLAQVPNYSDIQTTVKVTPSVSYITPVSFKVSLHKQLPEPQFVGPQVVVANQPQTVHLRGRGFNGITSLSTSVDVGGVQPVNVQRINDTQLVVQLPALDAGAYTLTIRNELNLLADTVNLRVVAPTPFTYGAFPTSGNPYWMVYDPWRKAAFFLNREGERVQRYQFNGSTWTSASVSMVAVSNLGMSPVGDSLITLSTVGRISLLNPDTLATTFQLDTQKPSGDSFTYLRFGIPSTNDGRSWMNLGSGWNSLSYFDHRSKTVKALVPNIATDFYGGPWMTMSRDGERMVIVQSASISPQPPMLYMDTTDLQLHINPADLTFEYNLSLSDNGNRLLLDGGEVRDASFGLVGRLALPDVDHFGVGSMISPDGNRVYVLSYPVAAWTQADPTLMPRVYVFDSSAMPANSLYLPLLGSFDLKHYPACHVNYSDACDVRMAISPDGQTLFAVGNQNFIVAPIPSLAPLASSRSNRVTAQSLPGAQTSPVSRPSRWPRGAVH